MDKNTRSELVRANMLRYARNEANDLSSGAIAELVDLVDLSKYRSVASLVSDS